MLDRGYIGRATSTPASSRQQASSTGSTGSRTERLRGTVENAIMSGNAQKPANNVPMIAVDPLESVGVSGHSFTIEFLPSREKPELQWPEVEVGELQQLKYKSPLRKLSEAATALMAIEPFAGPVGSLGASNKPRISLAATPLVPTLPSTRPSRRPLVSPTRPPLTPDRSTQGLTSWRGAAAGALYHPQHDPCRPGCVGATGAEYSTSRYGSGLCSIKIGIETEFYLAARHPAGVQGSLGDFVVELTGSYNDRVPRQHPRMREQLRPKVYRGPYTKWCLVREGSLRSNRSPWGIELVSPIFRAFPTSTWRKDVEAMWRYLAEDYHVLGTHLAGTHIHIGLEPAYIVSDLKRLAQAVIHFEPAFEILVHPSRRGNIYAKSNWLYSPGLAQKGLSRPGSIAAIEGMGRRDEVVNLLHRLRASGTCDDRDFAWNFYSWYSKGSIEFRKPEISMSSDDALSWAELAMSFVQAATSWESPRTLQDIPPTVGGLRWFLQRVGNEPGLNEPERLERFWRGKDPEAMLQPVIEGMDLPDRRILALNQRLARLIREDDMRIQKLITTSQGRYW